MELVERAEFLALLQAKFSMVADGEGHCVFVSGESGIGKTSLVKAFCKEQGAGCKIYRGACDALFTPRPLAPLYDIIWQLNSELWPKGHIIEERSAFFAEFFHEFSKQKGKTLIVFEDIHWADDATFDFIKFFSRRITQLGCLFILTYRDDHITSDHPLRNVLGQLPPDSFTRMQLNPLSREAVEKLAGAKGYSGEDVYGITGGNPFYVNEILSSYSLGVPDNVKDSIISAYNRQEGRTKEIWELLSVVPNSFEVKYLEKFEPLYASALERCLESRILLLKDGYIFFKHELFRRTIEASLSPLKRISLNKRILELFKDGFEQNEQLERIIHHAKNANDHEVVVYYAPSAARHAASVGAHTEARKLFLTAIEYYQGTDNELLIQFYESYAYECYLTNQVKEAIIYSTKALKIWKAKNNNEKIGNCMRFLSRLWWLDGNRKNAEKFGGQSIEVLSDQPPSPAKAMAYSNMSQIKMLFDQSAEALVWGEIAISVATKLGDAATLSHALNNVGSVYMHMQSSEEKGIDLLQQSLSIALKNSFHEHAARAYSNLGSNALKLKKYAFAEQTLDEGIRYCEQRDLDSSRSIKLSLKSLLNLETGNWKKAYDIADTLLKNENHLPAVTIVLLNVVSTIKMRRGDADALPFMLEATKKAFDTTELQRIVPSLIALLEYEWLTGKVVIRDDDLHTIKGLIEQSIYSLDKNELVFWLKKARQQHLSLNKIYDGYDISTVKKAQKAAALWEKIGCPYRQALALFEGTDEDKRKAISIVHELGADAVYEKMKMQMRNSGIRNIPRGMRKTTLSNPAQLTSREIDVLHLLKGGLQNKEIAGKLFISGKTVDHHISSILFKLDVNSRTKAVTEAIRMEIIK
jgi:DNA-binding CsgD family transcriptional regulator/tetratricopeptide (TPR) repeat protein